MNAQIASSYTILHITHTTN